MVKHLVTMTQSDGLITPDYLSLSCFLINSISTNRNSWCQHMHPLPRSGWMSQVGLPQLLGLSPHPELASGNSHDPAGGTRQQHL